MVIGKRLYTNDEFEKFIALPENQESRFELIDGEIIEKMPTEEHGLTASNLHGHLFIFLQGNEIGRLIIEVRHKMPGDDHNARLPDIAFTSTERALPVVKEGAVPQMPDLAIEIKSPTDSYVGLREKRHIISNMVRAWFGWSSPKSVLLRFTNPIRMCRF